MERSREKYVDRDKSRERHRDKSRDRHRDKSRDRHRDKSQDRHRDGDKSRDGCKDRDRSRDLLRDREKSRGGSLEDAVPGPSRAWSGEDLEDLGCRQRAQSGPDDVFKDSSQGGHRRAEKKGPRDSHEEAQRVRSHSREQGRKVRGDYGLREAMQDMTHLDLRDQELKDLEVARRLQEEELKASKNDKRAAQVAQDEEIARLLMEEERKVYKKSREREKPCMDKRRPEGDWKPPSEEVVRPRSREEFDHQRPRNHKPSRPSPRTHDYENVDSSYAYPASPYSARSSSRPEATYKGSYYRQ
ncbi:coiled-coil domain-containing protein 50 isoform X2 [Megalops cyprinoides]|uniref:coiled-coil domain-containing protein 50 isoform X2 n=1 Tax=Megalops cyprinoides TaxID=118141 RepID=UPI0018645A48|nr:coiled-coil domain-containing protein 50 isoform X2 [Megalops cyprinoides]